MAKKENKDLKFRLLKADEEATARLNAAVKAKEEEIVQQANVQCGAEIEKERKKATAAAAAAEEARQTAAAANQRAALANQETADAVDRAHKLRIERNELNQRMAEQLEAAKAAIKEQEEEIRRQKDALLSAEEARKRADAVAAEQRHLFEQEVARKRSLDNFLPSSTAANNPASSFQPPTVNL